MIEPHRLYSWEFRTTSMQHTRNKNSRISLYEVFLQCVIIGQHDCQVVYTFYCLHRSYTVLCFWLHPFLGAFPKLRKATISFTSVCPSLRMEQIGSHWTDFDETWYLRLFQKPVEKIQITLKSDKNNAYFTWRRFDVFDDISRNSS